MNFNKICLLKDHLRFKDSHFITSLDYFHVLNDSAIHSFNLSTFNLIDLDLLEEIEHIQSSREYMIYIGKTLRDIKCVIQDDENLRQHEIFIEYEEPKKLRIINANLPYTNIQYNDYSSLLDIIIAYKKNINDLSCYINELALIDQHCEIMEPINPSFKDDYRRILIDKRTWLHVNITQEGLANNIHLIGHSQVWHNMLQKGLLSWDHDKNIITNIMTIFDLTELPQNSRQLTFEEPGTAPLELVCSICLSYKLEDIPNIPMPLCQNSACGVYFHRSCLYQWLITSEPRSNVFGVATGSCPMCLHSIACNEIES